MALSLYADDGKAGIQGSRIIKALLNLPDIIGPDMVRYQLTARDKTGKND
jgi:hypothetical protein